MTAICGGGTSGPKTGVAAVVDYSSGLIASILASRGLNWLIPVIPLAGLPPLILSSFCAADPPAIPTFTSAETNALIQLTFGADFDSGLSKLGDLILHSIWYDACQCTSGSLTTFPTVTPPAGTPITVVANTPVAAPCQTQVTTDTIVAGSNASHVLTPSVAGLTPTGVQLIADGVVADATQNETHQLVGLNQAGGTVFLQSLSVTQASPGPKTGFWLLPPGIVSLTLALNSAGITGHSYVFTDTVNVFCGGQRPGVTQQPCCPPDVASQATLDAILKMVTLIQRQAVPFAYIPSTTHATLSGAGSFAISGLIGAAVHVTTLPTQIGREGTSPTEYFDMGFITFGTPDGYPSSYRLERESQVMLPTRCGAYTTIAYDLHPGVVATITELVREA